jgi:uncharacterized protein YigE (DUF2233 family)
MTYAIVNRTREAAAAVLIAFLMMPALGTAQGADRSSITEHEFTAATTRAGYPYMAGGVGFDERQLMAELGNNFNLKLTFAEESGIYLADVGLVITNKKGEEVVNTSAGAPWFYVQLPPGKYDVKATFAGQTKTISNISVSNSRQTSRMFHWDLPSEPEHPQLVKKLMKN